MLKQFIADHPNKIYQNNRGNYEYLSTGMEKVKTP